MEKKNLHKLKSYISTACIWITTFVILLYSFSVALQASIFLLCCWTVPHSLDLISGSLGKLLHYFITAILAVQQRAYPTRCLSITDWTTELCCNPCDTSASLSVAHPESRPNPPSPPCRPLIQGVAMPCWRSTNTVCHLTLTVTWRWRSSVAEGRLTLKVTCREGHLMLQVTGCSPCSSGVKSWRGQRAHLLPPRSAGYP